MLSNVEMLESRLLLAAQTLTFRQGVGGYFGAHDTYVKENDANNSFSTATSNQVENQAGQTTQSLIRFDVLFGSLLGQVPAGAPILSATLTVETGGSSGDESSNSTSLFRMLGGWADSSTWNSLVGGISANGSEASVIADDTKIPSVLRGLVSFNVTTTVQAWSNVPAGNFGWAMLANGSNSWKWSSSEKSDVLRRPILSITYDDNGQPVNHAPTVNAGTDAGVAMPSPAALDGSVVDDGLPGGPLTSQWSLVSGPGAVNFADALAVDTTATFSTAGEYLLRLTATDGELQASDDVIISVTDPSTTQPLNGLQSSIHTGEKPQSKVWKHNGTWWGVFADDNGTWVWRLDGANWTSVLKLSSSNSSRADVLPVGNVAHVLLYRGSGSKLASIEYVAGSPGTYKMWTVRPSLANVNLASGVETATIAMDGAGRLWVASEATTTVEVRYADGPYSTFSAPITIASGISSDDITTITSLPDGSVGVLWSNQNTERFGFRTHAAGAAPNVWSADEVPASQSAQNVGDGMADDHLSIVSGTDGTLYAAVKTNYNTSGYPAIALLVRRPNGQWDNLRMVDDTGTRGRILLNENDQSLMVLYSLTGGNGVGDIVYRKAPLSTLSFGSRITLMTGSLNNVTSTKQIISDDAVIVAGDTGLVVHGIRLAWPGTTQLAARFSQTSLAFSSDFGDEADDELVSL